MGSKKDVQLTFGLAIVLLLVGVVCYAAFPQEKPKEPVRIMFKCTAGKVLFTHNVHTADTGYALACQDCHHHPEDDDGEEALQACGTCHHTGEEAAVESCLDCHETEDIEDTEMQKKSDAFHGQCITCHKDADAGPVECSSCHVM
jgi:hypothetical protein